MRRWHIAVIGLALVSGVVLFRRARADDTPSRMSELEAAKLTNAWLQRQIVIKECNERLAPATKTIGELGLRYRFDPGQLGASVFVDEQGVITRKPVDTKGQK